MLCLLITEWVWHLDLQLDKARGELRRVVHNVNCFSAELQRHLWRLEDKEWEKDLPSCDETKSYKWSARSVPHWYFYLIYWFLVRNSRYLEVPWLPSFSTWNNNSNSKRDQILSLFRKWERSRRTINSSFAGDFGSYSYPARCSHHCGIQRGVLDVSSVLKSKHLCSISDLFESRWADHLHFILRRHSHLWDQTELQHHRHELPNQQLWRARTMVAHIHGIRGRSCGGPFQWETWKLQK